MRVAASLLYAAPLAAALPSWIPLYSREAEHGKLGAVASESEICSQIGGDILKSGGNAADSMIATVLCVGVVGMYHSGIGGGGEHGEQNCP
jgi:gamma-glutamyltranspeptidase/glutathione hydrolase